MGWRSVLFGGEVHGGLKARRLEEGQGRAGSAVADEQCSRRASDAEEYLSAAAADEETCQER